MSKTFVVVVSARYPAYATVQIEGDTEEEIGEQIEDMIDESPDLLEFVIDSDPNLNSAHYQIVGYFPDQEENSENC